MRVEVQVAYLDSALEVGDVRDVFDVLPRLVESFIVHEVLILKKQELQNKAEQRIQVEDLT